jgi:gamma-glutamyl-gamma-aminobutyrate hydrolase PuuD
MGVQWHPECLTQRNEQMLKLFVYFIEKCNWKSGLYFRNVWWKMN